MKTLKLLALAAVVGCSVHAQAEAVLRIATDATYPPFEFQGKDGKPAGFEVELAQALCNEMKARCEIIDQAWDGLIPGLQVRKYDAIISSMNITEDRRKVVDFSDVYYHMKNRFVARKGANIDISEAGLKGKTIAVQISTPQDKFVTERFEKVAKITRTVNAMDPMLELGTGRADLTFGNVVQLQEGFLDKADGKNYEFTGPTFDGRQNGVLGLGVAVALRKNDSALKERFNKAIAAVKQNGTFKQIGARYFAPGQLDD